MDFFVSRPKKVVGEPSSSEKFWTRKHFRNNGISYYLIISKPKDIIGTFFTPLNYIPDTSASLDVFNMLLIQSAVTMCTY